MGSHLVHRYSKYTGKDIVPTKTQAAFFRAAEAISELSDSARAQIGCVVALKHRIVSSGYSSGTKCYPIQFGIELHRFGEDSNHRGKVHAEIHALLPLLKQHADLSRADVYVVRRRKDGSLAMARPCPGCISLLKENGLRRAYFSTNTGFSMQEIEDMGGVPAHPTGGALVEI